MKTICLTTIIVFLILANDYGDTEASKYNAIVQRNAFNLREPEPPKPPEPPPPSVSVKLTGITTLLNTKRVFLVVQEQGKPAESKMLQQGDKEGPIEVVEIDEVNGKVKIINSGKEQILDFEKDGIKPPVAPPQPQPGVAVPGAVPLPGAVNPNAPRTVIPALPGATIPGATVPTVNPTIPQPQQTINVPPMPPGTLDPSAVQSEEQKKPPKPKPVKLPGEKK